MRCCSSMFIYLVRMYACGSAVDPLPQVWISRENAWEHSVLPNGVRSVAHRGLIIANGAPLMARPQILGKGLKAWRLTPHAVIFQVEAQDVDTRTRKIEFRSISVRNGRTSIAFHETFGAETARHVDREVSEGNKAGISCSLAA